jgi:hypothetical protein
MEKGLSRATADGPPVVRGVPYLADGALADGITPDRPDRRHTQLGQFDDGLRRGRQAGGGGRTRERAFSLLTSPRLKAAFDPGRAYRRRRDRHGRTPFGQDAPVARRLVQAGARFADVGRDRCRERLNVAAQAGDTPPLTSPA